MEVPNVSALANRRANSFSTGPPDSLGCAESRPWHAITPRTERARVRDRRGAVRLIVFLTHAKDREQELFIAMAYFFQIHHMEEPFPNLLLSPL